MQLQRQHFLLSYFKTLSAGPARIKLTASRMTTRCSINWATGEILDLLVDFYMNGVLSDEEFVVLYGENRSKNLDLPYDEYGRFDLR